MKIPKISFLKKGPSKKQLTKQLEHKMVLFEKRLNIWPRSTAKVIEDTEFYEISRLGIDEVHINDNIFKNLRRRPALKVGKHHIKTHDGSLDKESYPDYYNFFITKKVLKKALNVLKDLNKNLNNKDIVDIKYHESTWYKK